MIIQTFDNGWGPEFPVKQLENTILKPTLDQLHNSDKRVVVINSSWLHDRKFVTYYDDFADITDMDLTKPANVAPFLSILSEKPRSYWQKKLVDLNQKIVYNKQQFYKYVDDQKLKAQKGIVWQA
jgi:hypothetical protein